MIKGTIQQEDVTLVNIYVHNIRAAKYVKQIMMDIKGKTDKNTVIVGDFNTPLTSMDRSSRQKINKDPLALNHIIDQMYVIDTFRTFHPKAAECAYFSSAHGMFSRRNHLLGHKTNLIKFKRIEIISSIFSNHNAMKLNINHKKNTEHTKHTKAWKLNNMLLNNG